jgi:hypothetical protein
VKLQGYEGREIEVNRWGVRAQSGQMSALRWLRIGASEPVAPSTSSAALLVITGMVFEPARPNEGRRVFQCGGRRLEALSFPFMLWLHLAPWRQHPATEGGGELQGLAGFGETQR